MDPDQLASPEASRSGSTLFSKEGIAFRKFCTYCVLIRLNRVRRFGLISLCSSV